MYLALRCTRELRAWLLLCAARPSLDGSAKLGHFSGPCTAGNRPVRLSGLRRVTR